MSSATASLISSLAPDDTGLNKIIGIPPGTQMFYDSIMHNPHQAMGGYGMREDQRYGQQLGSYLDALAGVNEQRQGIANRLLDNDERDSHRTFSANVLKELIDNGLFSNASPEILHDIMDTGNPSTGTMLDNSDELANRQRRATTIGTVGQGVNQLRQGGIVTPPESIRPYGLDGLTMGTPTAVAAAGAGNSGSAANMGKTVTRQYVLRNGQVTEITTTVPGVAGGPQPGDVPLNVNPTTGMPDLPGMDSSPGAAPTEDPADAAIRQGNAKQQGQMNNLRQKYDFRFGRKDPDTGDIHLFVGNRGEPTNLEIVIDGEGKLKTRPGQ